MSKRRKARGAANPSSGEGAADRAPQHRRAASQAPFAVTRGERNCLQRARLEPVTRSRLRTLPTMLIKSQAEAEWIPLEKRQYTGCPADKYRPCVLSRRVLCTPSGAERANLSPRWHERCYLFASFISSEITGNN